jgi:GMP synthase (glutamine-hydrolysing)
MADPGPSERGFLKRAIVIQHVFFEGLGILGEILGRRKYRIQSVDAPTADFDADLGNGADLLIVLGGPIGVYEEDRYPFLIPEMKMIESCLKTGTPFLGVCLGSQLLAKVLGARVYPGGKKEIGWSSLTLTEEGRFSPLRYLASDGIQVLHWHGDTFDLPDGSTLLASSEIYANQAFRYGDNAIGLQFHAEVTAQDLERWYVGHAVELSLIPGLDVRDLRACSHRLAPMLVGGAAKMFEEWLGSLEKVP